MNSFLAQRSPLGRRHQHGLSLIELMVALVLGLLVVGAAFAIFHSNQMTYQSNQGLARMQENARVAFELVSQDIRGAGGNSCSKYALVALDDGSEEAELIRDTYVSGDATRMRLVGGDNVAYRVVSATSNSITLDEDDLPASGNVFDDGDVLLLCNPGRTFVVEVSGDVTGATVTFTPSLPAGVTLTGSPAAPTTAMIARMRDVEWFVEANGRGGALGNSLYVSRNGGDREEVAEGVQDITIGYLHSGAADYVAAALPRPAEVVAVRVTMTLRGQDVDGAQLTRQTSNVVSLRKGSLNPS
nr:prepilin-type N-terminal cleavage/methylation domain-containing protein [uncultured Pseudoxanthomonas sp.]